MSGVHVWFNCGVLDGNAECAHEMSQVETPTVRNVVVRNVEMHGVTSNVGIIEGLPESPFQAVTLENIKVDGQEKGWTCQHFHPGCTWPAGGCAIGTASKVVPSLPDSCLQPYDNQKWSGEEVGRKLLMDD
ncbi:hypothetical protein CYMTET_30707 [Cymbomonas tetramitiformis]|uniref:Polygalacturonase n=1 Tax=Cymbomonas tetramitiformis TaxID=36881 RepID=A0AAE0KTX9_9CHLO|nr:hypothetical protein CYMTET_30707 [Cymbomonas tetramitiformis]